MKVLNFLEWIRNYPHKTNWKDWATDVLSMSDFYNQPFSTDMIVKLFDKVEKDGIIYYFEKGGYLRFYEDYLYLEYKEKEEAYAWGLPKTLNGFITLCNLAGIELIPNESNWGIG
jgi:hypothetical protein